MNKSAQEIAIAVDELAHQMDCADLGLLTMAINEHTAAINRYVDFMEAERQRQYDRARWGGPL